MVYGKGGYILVDFTGIDLYSGGTSADVYKQLKDNVYGKVVLGTHLVYNDEELKDEFFTVETSGTSYVLKNASYTITITSAGVISCVKVVIPEPVEQETIIFETLFALTTYLTTNEIEEASGIYNVYSDDSMSLFKVGLSGGDITYKGADGTNLNNFQNIFDTFNYIAYNTKLKLVIIIGVHEK